MNEKKRVPLYLGEGPDRIHIGTAEVEQKENGLQIECQLDGWRGNGDLTNPIFHGLVPRRNPLIKNDDFSSIGWLPELETS
jgi:hypothetical protein